MSYFSRLTDIVTCSLTRLLEDAPDPQSALVQIVSEMEEGLAGAKRSVRTAVTTVERLQGELDEHRGQISFWTTRAKEELARSNENDARLAIIRKRQIEDLIAGLEQQMTAAEATRDHLVTTQRALEARLAEARRRQQELAAESSAGGDARGVGMSEGDESLDVDRTRAAQVDAELEALKRELGQQP